MPGKALQAIEHAPFPAMPAFPGDESNESRNISVIAYILSAAIGMAIKWRHTILVVKKVAES